MECLQGRDDFVAVGGWIGWAGIGGQGDIVEQHGTAVELKVRAIDPEAPVSFAWNEYE